MLLFFIMYQPKIEIESKHKGNITFKFKNHFDMIFWLQKGVIYCDISNILLLIITINRLIMVRWVWQWK